VRLRADGLRFIGHDGLPGGVAGAFTLEEVKGGGTVALGGGSRWFGYCPDRAGDYLRPDNAPSQAGCPRLHEGRGVRFQRSKSIVLKGAEQSRTPRLSAPWPCQAFSLELSCFVPRGVPPTRRTGEGGRLPLPSAAIG